LAASRDQGSNLAGLVKDGQLDADNCPQLVEGVRSAAVAGISQVVEIDRVSTMLRVECFPIGTADVRFDPAASGERSSAVTEPPLSGARTADGPTLDPRAIGATLVGLLVTREAELRAARRRLEQVSRAESLGLLVGSVAHDFNNLLTGIRGSLALVKHHVSQEGRDSALVAADAAAQRAGEVTGRLLAFGRGPERVATKADPRLVLQETIDLLRCMPDATRVDTEIEPNLGLVEMLPAALQQVTLNLLINASDAVRSLGEVSGVTLRARKIWQPPRHSGDTPSAWLRISVLDSGPGIDPDIRARIFEPFFTTKGEAGNGLGLCSVKELVERSGGWLEVESELSKGSAFHAYVPLTDDQDTDQEENATQHMPNHRVLICDDEGRLGELTVGLLEEFGFEAASVVRGDEALAAVCGDVPPDALLLDVNLSAGISAVEVLNGLLKRGGTVPVVLTSGLAREDVPEILLQHPSVVGYLPKPYMVEDLVSVITSAIDS
jgi:signal transduction histidine kinase/CheY-like chemotaxis protein